MVPNALQASVCDEQLMSIGGEIALSRKQKMKKKKEEKKKKKKKRKRKREKEGKRGGKQKRTRKKKEKGKVKKYYDCVSQYAVHRFLEPLMRSVRQQMSENRWSGLWG